jgi:hypothetical protein
MIKRDEAKFVLHGLEADNRVVRADVFAQKFRTLVQALQLADRLTNGSRQFHYMITELEIGSASVTVREKRSKNLVPRGSGIDLLQRTTMAIYNSDPNVERYPRDLIKSVRRLGSGVAKKFSHAELSFPYDNIIRIDDFLARQAERVVEEGTLEAATDRVRFFRGTAIGEFEGTLKEIDARGTVLRGKLHLTSGSVEIDCVMHKNKLPEARDSFDRRVYVNGLAHYDEDSALPVRIDVTSIAPVGLNKDLIVWRGRFPVENHDDVDLDDDW